MPADQNGLQLGMESRESRPNRQEHWFLKSMQAGRARPLAARGMGHALLLSTGAAGGNRVSRGRPMAWVCVRERERVGVIGVARKGGRDNRTTQSDAAHKLNLSTNSSTTINTSLGGRDGERPIIRGGPSERGRAPHTAAPPPAPPAGARPCCAAGTVPRWATPASRGPGARTHPRGLTTPPGRNFE